MEFWIEREVLQKRRSAIFKSGIVGADVSGGFKGSWYEISVEKTKKTIKRVTYFQHHNRQSKSNLKSL